jgi:hypothetical protein
MKRWWLLGLGLIGLGLIAMLGYYWAEDDEVSAPKTASVLAKTQDDCTAIAQKAAMHLPEALPFQKQEKIARTARVFETCMHDRGWTENPAWAEFAQPIAQQQANTENISIDEAYETLRRKHMLLFEVDNAQPLYWHMQNSN